MINLIKLQCPNCSANLEVKDDAKQCFCTYCGTKILLSNENEHTYRIIDEARIKEAELNHQLELRRMEKESGLAEASLEEKKLERDIALAQAYGEQAYREHEKMLKKSRFFVVLLYKVLAIVGGIIGGTLVGFMLNQPPVIFLGLIAGLVIAFKVIPEREKKIVMTDLGYARFPKNLLKNGEVSPTSVSYELEQAGFTNIVSENLHDIRNGLFHKQNDYVDKVLVNGKSPSGGKLYPCDAPVVIIYHGQ